MSDAVEQRTTIWQHAYGAAFFLGACMLVVGAFFLLILVPVMSAVEAVRLAGRGEFARFLARDGWLLAASGLAWIVAIAVSVLMSRAEKLNREFDRQFRISLKAGATPFARENATARDIAGHLLSRTEPNCPGFDFSEVIDEDYGAGFWASADADTIWIAVSAASDDIEKPDGRFVVSVTYDPGLSLLKRLRHRPDRDRYQTVHRAVSAAVRSLRPPK